MAIRRTRPRAVPAHPPARRSDAPGEPLADRRSRLVTDPQPGDLDHRLAQPRIARLGDAAIDAAALPGDRGEPGIDLAPVAEAAEQRFEPEHRGELRPDALEFHQQRRRL